MAIDLKALRERMYQLAQPTEYYLALTDQERQSMERTAWNHYRDFGRRLKIAPRLFYDLARYGTNMKYMEPNGEAEAWGAKP